MKILLVHNKYQQAGGEDVVFQSEGDLLVKHGHAVERVIFDNTNIKTTFQKLLSGIKAIYNPASAAEIQRKIDEFDPEVIHVHNFLPLASPSVLFVANRNRIPVVMTLHNYRLICPSATLFHNKRIYEKSIHSVFPWDAVIRGVYRNSKIQTAAVAIMTAWHSLMGTWRHRVDQYIALTHFAKEKFKSSTLSIPEGKLTVKPNFVADQGRGMRNRDDYFLYVGRLTEEKGIRTLLEAARQYNFSLTIIGDGPLRSLVEDEAKNNPQIRYLGFLHKDNVMYYLKRCKALIFPSIWYEGFPVTILEAFSTGTTVVASNIGGMAEIIQDHKNGIHFEAGNARDLVAKIMELEMNPNLARNISDSARLTYIEFYTPGKNCYLLTAIYDRVISQKLRAAKQQLRETVPALAGASSM